jgi:hypothetical protein
MPGSQVSVSKANLNGNFSVAFREKRSDEISAGLESLAALLSDRGLRL